MFKKYIFLITLFFTFFCFSQDDTENYVIDFITTKQGLSHNYVSNLVSDDLNMKWIGTENGITKFNGYDYDYLKPSNELNGQFYKNIEILFLDSQSNLWIGTKSGGLSYLDIKNNRIKDYNYLIDIANEGDLRITSISQDSTGNIWVGTWKNGVFVIDLKKDKLIEHFNLYNPIYSIAKDFKNNIWFCSSNKLYQFNNKNKKTTTHKFNGLITNILSDKSRNKVWVATSGDDSKLYSYSYESQEIEAIETNVVSGFSKKLSIDKDNRIWIGTWK